MQVEKRNFIKLFWVIFVLFPFTAQCQRSYNLAVFQYRQKDVNSFPQADSGRYKKKNNNGLYFGANLGFFFANKYNAQYYNGSGKNDLDSVINYTYNYNAIKQNLMYDFSLSELPSKMKYSPAFLVGLYFKYTIRNSAVFFQFNFSKLSTKDVFTIQYYDPYNPSIPIYKEEGIYGSEQRANIDFGYSYTFPSRDKNRPYLELGFNLNDTKFLSNKIKIEGLDFNLLNYHDSYYNIEQGGVGMGGFIGGGMELNFSESVSINPGFDLYFTKYRLGDYYQLKPNYSIFVRAILNGLL
jgi:hypothetical protein